MSWDFMYLPELRTKAITVGKIYPHQCSGCGVKFEDGCHNTKRCKTCRSNKKPLTRKS